ncbi:MAG: HAD family hydrolase [Oscillospiraceae bacterium]|nr:HAD family hydrolase [Oscillospiraceae bacterium]
MVKYYIFDMDGTLCDSMTYWRMEAENVIDPRDANLMSAAYDRMREHYTQTITLKEGVIDALKAARAQGIRCCIASATAKNVSQPFLDRSGLMEYMEFYVDCFEVGAFKNKPDIYLTAAERLGADISECAVFEDAEYCAKTAHEAGFYVVGVYDKQSASEGDCSKYSDMYIGSFTDFKGIDSER